MPRGAAALGFAQYLPSENMLMTVQQMTDMMCMALGGRAAEQVILGKISTGKPIIWSFSSEGRREAVFKFEFETSWTGLGLTSSSRIYTAWK